MSCLFELLRRDGVRDGGYVHDSFNLFVRDLCVEGDVHAHAHVHGSFLIFLFFIRWRSGSISRWISQRVFAASGRTASLV